MNDLIVLLYNVLEKKRDILMNFWVMDRHAMEALKAKKISDRKLLVMHGLIKEKLKKEPKELKPKKEKKIKKELIIPIVLSSEQEQVFSSLADSLNRLLINK